MLYKWTLMETELSLMYDILYTKAAMVHTLAGYCIRVASLLTVAASLLLSTSAAKLVREAALLAVIRRLVDLWNGWSTQFLVLFSLALQVVVLFLAGVRRHKGGGPLIGILWLAYQLADQTVTYAMGNLGASSALREHQLVAFWAPFLLLHLGGPDNICNLTLAGQALGAGYVLYKHISSGGEALFSLAAIFVSAVGFVKFSEKILTLRRASLSTIRDSARTETPANNCTFFLECEPPRRDTAQEEEFFKKHAHALFHVCKSAMVDSSVDDDDPNRISHHGSPARLLRGFKDQGMSYKWRLMEMELSLMYDILYTKAAMVHTLAGYCIRIASVLVVTASVLLFRFSGKAGYSRVDVAATYALLGGALLLEMKSLLSALFSSWTFAFLCTTPWSHLRHVLLCSGRRDRLRRMVVSLHRIAYVTGIAGCFRLSRRWHGTMGQCSMLDMCTRRGTGKPTALSGMLGSSTSWTVEVPKKVKEQVVEHIGRIVKRKEINTLGGKLIRTKEEETDVEAIKTLSHYMMFLLVERPAMLPGLAQIKLRQRTEKTLAEKWKELTPAPSPNSASWIRSVMELCSGGPNTDSRLQRREQLAKRLLERRPESDIRGVSSRVRFGIELARELVKWQSAKQDSLQILLDVWTDILVYTANRCSRESHAKQLSGGGEFTTLIWLMAEHYHQASYCG
ncbi:unnamed protein product [Urochloa decumbens]|uniref:DUF4220 domain-containing protein n=1 Tax=Urochloa decumbens TaxID=240449 RepID=A0ABC9AFM1_9POAL